jgi:hypothetical protein
LKPFTPNATCSKCGYDKVRTIFCEEGDSRTFRRSDQGWHHECDVLLRVCERCSFHWEEEPMSSDPRGAQEESR